MAVSLDKKIVVPLRKAQSEHAFILVEHPQNAYLPPIRTPPPLRVNLKTGSGGVLDKSILIS